MDLRAIGPGAVLANIEEGHPDWESYGGGAKIAQAVADGHFECWAKSLPASETISCSNVPTLCVDCLAMLRNDNRCSVCVAYASCLESPAPPSGDAGGEPDGGGGEPSPPWSPPAWMNFSTAPVPSYCNSDLMTSAVPTSPNRRRLASGSTCTGSETWANTDVPFRENSCVPMSYYYASDVPDSIRAPIEKFTQAATCVWGSRPRLAYTVYSASAAKSAAMLASYCTDLSAHATAAGDVAPYGCSAGAQSARVSRVVGSDDMSYSNQMVCSGAARTPWPSPGLPLGCPAAD